MDERWRRETREAVDAGEQALKSLYGARDLLNSAKTWGLFDLFGGGMFTTVMKHSKIEKAAVLLERAKGDVRRFQRELRDVEVSADVNLNIGSFLSFADFFFDGVVADYLVQSRIRDAEDQTEDAIYYIEGLVRELRRELYNS